jgi:hypothetical protein
VLRQ